MNKKQLISNAKTLLQEYKDLKDEQRAYDGEKWHAQSVKRYNDGIDIDDILQHPSKYKKYFYIKDQDKDMRKYLEQLQDEFTEETLNNMYYNWLETEQEQLRYELSDLQAITEGSDREHKTLQHITEQGRGSNHIIDKSYIYFLGRSGGWCCFQDSFNGRAEELEEWINDSGELYPFEDFKNDILESTEELAQAIEEINYTKQFIKRFNDNLNFKYEIFYRIAESIEAQEEEENRLATNIKDFKSDIKGLASDLDNRAEQFKADTTLANNIRRNAKSIIKLIK